MSSVVTRVLGALIAVACFASVAPASSAWADEGDVAREGASEAMPVAQGSGMDDGAEASLSGSLGEVANGVVLTAQADLVAGTSSKGVYACANGWKLAYEVDEDGMCQITGIEEAGDGDALVIPDSIDGHEVAAIASKAFYGGVDGPSKSLSQITLPNTVKTIGAAAFMGSGIASMTVPASVQAIPAKCFAACKKLEQLTFEGDTLQNIGEQAFNGCSELVQLDIPELTTNIERQSYRIGRSCFYRCSKLQTIVFRGGPLTKSGNYISNSDCFDYCTSLKNLVYYCKRSAIPRATGSDSTLADVNEYHTMYFFRTLDDAKSASNALYSITCLSTTKVTDILAGTVSRADVLDEKGAFKAKPVWDESQSLPALVQGSSWGLVDVELQNGDDELKDSYSAVMVSPDSLDYGWVTSETIEQFRATTTQSGMTTSYPKYYLDDAGTVVGLDDLMAYGPSGAALPESSYTLVFEQEKTSGTGSSATTTYQSVAVPAETGRYRVQAQGAAESNEGTKTPWVIFDVARFKPTVVSYDNESIAARLGSVAQAAASATRAAKGACAVVVPASDWRYQLIGAALAGAGSGFVLVDGKDDYSSRATTAFIESGVSAVQIVGSTSKVPESRVASDEAYLLDYLAQRTIRSKTRYAKDATVQQLADQVYTSIRDLKAKNNTAYGQGWGTTAIVASPDAWWDTLFAAQYAYARRAPVFFTQDNGLLSTDDLGYLKNDGFTQVVIAGDASYVPNSCAQGIKDACGMSPVRLCAAGDVLTSALDVAAAAGGEPSFVAIADAESPADVVAASVLAAAKGGVALPCAGTADSKRIQEYLRAYLADKGQTSITALSLVGDTARLDPTLKERMQAMWTEPQATAVTAGDTIGMKDFAYRVAAKGKVALTRVRDASMTKATLGAITYGSSSYELAGLSSGVFSSCASLRKLAFGPGIATVPAKAFQGMKALAAVSLGSSVTSIGASAFSGCGKLSTVTGKKVRSIGASAFSGCGKLVVCAPLKTATTLGASAFANCASLRSVTLSAAKAVPTCAFTGCTKLKYAAAPKAASLGASAFAGCSVLGTINAVSATSIGASVAAKDKQVKKLTLTKAASIGKNAFEGCARMKILRLPAAKTLGASAFAGCTSLKTLIAAKTATIGASAFKGCPRLKAASLPKATTIGANAFANCGALASLRAPAAKTLGASAFAGCTSLANAKLESAGLSKIGAKAFSGCSKLARMSLTSTKLTAGGIGANAFKGMPASAKVSVPKSKVAAYKKLFVKKGLPSKAVVG